tara:strand:- start:2171 stop:2356 length:186 start_codon:yes stop_codon:yes gene_type:complete
MASKKKTKTKKAERAEVWRNSETSDNAIKRAEKKDAKLWDRGAHVMPESAKFTPKRKQQED